MCDGEEHKLRMPIVATESGASGLAERALMMPFGLCMCRVTWCQPRAAADGHLRKPSCEIEGPLFKVGLGIS